MEEDHIPSTTGPQCSESDDLVSSTSDPHSKIVSCLLKRSASNGKRKPYQVSFDLHRNQCIKYDRFGTMFEDGTHITGYISSCGVAPGEDPNYKRTIHYLPGRQPSRPSPVTFLVLPPTHIRDLSWRRDRSQLLTGFSSRLYPTQFAAHRAHSRSHRKSSRFGHVVRCNGTTSHASTSKPTNVFPAESRRCHMGKISLAGKPTKRIPDERLKQSTSYYTCTNTTH